MISKDQLTNMQPEEYLDKTGITSTLKELFITILENRPSNPL